MSEMVVLFGSLYQIEGIDKHIAVDRAETLFGNLDINGDGDITEEEFINSCLKVIKQSQSKHDQRRLVTRIFLERLDRFWNYSPLNFSRFNLLQ